MDTKAIDAMFDPIYHRTYRKTAGYLTARCQSLEDVEDLLQETYLSVYRMLAARGQRAFDNEEAYVISTAKAKLIDFYRKRGREKASCESDAEDSELLTQIPDSASTPEETMLSRESAEAAQRIITQKAPHLQQAFYLHYSFGLTFPEIAALQGQNPSTLRSGVFRLVKELRDALERSSL